MSAAEQLRLLIGVCLVACVAADTGDDFSNNLFSDLAPLLSLFGERVTMQFMSLSTGWADHIILAMVPLGILTAIVGAIRVGGPSWLRAIIGRAREPRAVVEAELMSSTSHEVCELWNGQEVVRVMGEGPIREFIIMVPAGSGESSTKIDQDVPVAELAKDNKYLDSYEPTIPERMLGRRQQCNKEEDGSAPANGPPVAIFRNRGTREMSNAGTYDSAPNLSFNVNGQVGRGELYAVAVFAIILQLGLLAYYAAATSYPPLRSSLLKNDTFVADYAFPCTAAGTVLMAAGVLICSSVVEKSTFETKFLPKHAGVEARLVWLQTPGTVNDQAFEAFAIFPRNAQAVITTSRRATPKLKDLWPGRYGNRENGQRESTPSSPPNTSRRPPASEWEFSQVLTLFGTFFSICGFIVQFVGLRAMHWTASVILLGATILMTALRVLVRRNLAKIPESQRLIPGHELDWLAMTFADDLQNAPWLCPSKVGDMYSRPWERGSWDGRIAAVERPTKCEMLKAHQDIAGTKANESTAHRVVRIRRDLGELADWHGPASAESIALARAIEVVMDAIDFLADTHTNEKLVWTLPARPNESGRESITFRLERQENENWKAFSDEIEAALSLWLYSTYTLENPREKDQRETRIKARKDDTWLRAKGTPIKPSLRLLGSHTAALLRDLWWWMPNGAERVIEVVPDSTKGADDAEVEFHRVVGFTSNAKPDPPTDVSICEYRWNWSPESPSEDTSLAVESYSPLKTLYAQHMFTAFMWTAAKTMKKRIRDRTDIQPTKRDILSGDSAWQSFTLHNTNLAKMAQDIADTGLGILGDIYLAIIPPLSAEKKLPRVDTIIDWTREHAKPHEKLGHWNEAADAYLWLFQKAKSFSENDDISVTATALLVEFLTAISDAVELRRAQHFDERDIQELEGLKSTIDTELRNADGDILERLLGLYEIQGLRKCPLAKKPRHPEGVDIELKFRDLHWEVCSDPYWEVCRDLDWSDLVGDEVNEKDIFDWTLLHYAAAMVRPKTLKALLKSRADVSAQDIRGRTPLHYACQSNNPSIVLDLLQERAEINIRDTDGMAPIHFAAMYGHHNTLKSLIEAGADIDIVDGSGRTPLFWAAFGGHENAVQLLRGANLKLRDHNGRTALHLVAMVVASSNVEQKEAVVKYLIEEAKADKEATDRFGRTPLHYAAGDGHTAIVKYLIEEAKVNKEATDRDGSTPLHHAARSGHTAVVKYLIKKAKANKEAEDREDDGMPLHYAARSGHTAVVKYLIEEAEADKEATDRSGWMPLHYAISGYHTAVVKYLIEEAKVNKEAIDWLSGSTPLHHAAGSGHTAIVKYLIEEAKANKEAADRDGDGMPLHYAARSGHTAVVKYLIEEAKANKEVTNKSVGATPLHYAAGSGHTGVVKYLIEEAKANKDAIDREGNTPLKYAIRDYHTAVVTYLIEEAKVDKRDYDIF